MTTKQRTRKPRAAKPRKRTGSIPRDIEPGTEFRARLLAGNSPQAERVRAKLKRFLDAAHALEQSPTSPILPPLIRAGFEVGGGLLYVAQGIYDAASDPNNPWRRGRGRPAQIVGRKAQAFASMGDLARTVYRKHKDRPRPEREQRIADDLIELLSPLRAYVERRPDGRGWLRRQIVRPALRGHSEESKARRLAAALMALFGARHDRETIRELIPPTRPN